MTDLHPVKEALRQIVGDRFVLDGASLAPFLEDWRGRYHGSAFCAVRPGSTEEVSRILMLAHHNNLSIVPQGGNTGLCGGATPSEAGHSLVVLLDRMNTIIEISPLDHSVTVQAGCILETLQREIAEAGFHFPLSLGAEGSCQIGGNIATNAGGTSVVKYGTMRDLVLGLRVVLPDGSCCDWSLPLRKNAAGYDLKQLFIGSEGTLGIITEATLKIFPKPAQIATVMASVESVEAALGIFSRFSAILGERIRAFEIMNAAQIALVLAHVPGNRAPFEGGSPYALLIEVTETLPQIDLAALLLELLEAEIESGTVLDAVVPTNIGQSDALWRLRHSVSEANRSAGISVAHDTAVPVSRQARFIYEAERRIGEAYPSFPIPMVGHIGDGNIHVVVIIPHAAAKNSIANRQIITHINRIIDDIVMEIGGTISAEHGIGQSNKARLQEALGPASMALMRAIKKAVDPQLIMNPQKIMDMGA